MERRRAGQLQPLKSFTTCQCPRTYGNCTSRPAPLKTIHPRSSLLTWMKRLPTIFRLPQSPMAASELQIVATVTLKNIQLINEQFLRNRIRASSLLPYKGTEDENCCARIVVGVDLNLIDKVAMS